MVDLTPAEVLRRAKALIAEPEKWTKGENARDAAGNWVWADSARAVCWCAQGAINAVAPDSLVALCNALGFVNRTAGVMSNIVTLNDAPTTTHADIMALFDRAIAAAEAENA